MLLLIWGAGCFAGWAILSVRHGVLVEFQSLVYVLGALVAGKAVQRFPEQFASLRLRCCVPRFRCLLRAECKLRPPEGRAPLVSGARMGVRGLVGENVKGCVDRRCRQGAAGPLRAREGLGVLPGIRTKETVRKRIGEACPPNATWCALSRNGETSESRQDRNEPAHHPATPLRQHGCLG